MHTQTTGIHGQPCKEPWCHAGHSACRGGAQHKSARLTCSRAAIGEQQCGRVVVCSKRPSGSAMRAASRHAQRKRKKTNATRTNERNDRDGASCNQSFADPNSSSLAPPFFGFCGPLLRMWGGHKTLVGESGVAPGVSPQMRPQKKDKRCGPGNTVHQDRENEPGTSPGRPQVTPRGGDRTRSLQ